jgi:hypothetical protein
MGAVPGGGVGWPPAVGPGFELPGAGWPGVDKDCALEPEDERPLAESRLEGARRRLVAVGRDHAPDAAAERQSQFPRADAHPDVGNG